MVLHGLAFFFSSHYPGAKSDLAIFQTVLEKHISFTLKFLDEKDISDDDTKTFSWGIVIFTKAMWA